VQTRSDRQTFPLSCAAQLHSFVNYAMQQFRSAHDLMTAIYLHVIIYIAIAIIYIAIAILQYIYMYI